MSIGAKLSNHTIKILAVFAILVFTWHVNNLSPRHNPRWSPSRAPPPQALELELPVQGVEVLELCRRHRLEPFPLEQIPNRKVYDLLLVNTELEMLEVRMGEMYPYVDYFVILESDRTFTDKEKPLHILENWDRFAPFHDKMIRRTMNVTALNFKPGDAWDREHKSRDAMFTQVVPFLEAEMAPTKDDVLLVSDVDEIIKPAVLRALRACAFPPRTSIVSNFYYYSFQWLARERWGHPQATVYRGPKDTVMPQDLRRHAGDYTFEHGGWHCSYCFSTMEETVKKVDSFSHQEYNLPEFKDPNKILQRVRFGTDFFDRKSAVFDYLPNNQDIPAFLKKNRERYLFMLDRDPPSGNFRDVPADGNVTSIIRPPQE